MGDVDHRWRHGSECNGLQILLFLLGRFDWLWCYGSGWIATLAEENDDDDDEDGGERHVYLMVRLMVSAALIYPDVCARTVFTYRHPLNVASLFIFES